MSGLDLDPYLTDSYRAVLKAPMPFSPLDTEPLPATVQGHLASMLAKLVEILPDNSLEKAVMNAGLAFEDEGEEETRRAARQLLIFAVKAWGKGLLD